MMNIKFIKLPKALFEGTYTELSSDGKLLYSLLLDRSLLSEKNSLTDDNGRVIVYFTNNEVCDKLKCSHDKATKLFRELERFKLICRHKQGKGKPDLIYVRQIARSEYSAVSNADNQDSGMRQISVTECG
ncbi:MAG: replication initiator protein A, partial [Acutalibacteraceae bacterium]|nr:replication initiator protein A [Acutalibacteraceae bacterium]